jgi:hypothetical protein
VLSEVYILQHTPGGEGISPDVIRGKNMNRGREGKEKGRKGKEKGRKGKEKGRKGKKKRKREVKV